MFFIMNTSPNISLQDILKQSDCHFLLSPRGKFRPTIDSIIVSQ